MNKKVNFHLYELVPDISAFLSMFLSRRKTTIKRSKCQRSSTLYTNTFSLFFAISFRSPQVASLLLVYLKLSTSVAVAEFGVATILDGPDGEQLNLEPIAGTHDFLSNITRDISGKPWNDARKESRITRSLRLAKCEKLQNSTCFGAKIQYKFTSIQLSNEESQENSLRKLYELEASRFVPMCWAVIQVSRENSKYRKNTI